MIAQHYQCDASGCEQVRGKTNHWFCVTEGTAGLLVQTWDQAYQSHNLEFAKHFCGQTHALQYISSEMGS